MFSLLLVKAIGKLTHWTWLIPDSPPFLVKAPAQALSVGLIVISLITIDEKNYLIFSGLSMISAILMTSMGWRFDLDRKTYVRRVPLTGKDGSQAQDRMRRLLYRTLVIGTEDTMYEHAKAAFYEARRKNGGLSLLDFMGGYGTPNVYNPEALWPREILAKISSRMTMLLIGIVLTGVMALYLAALSFQKIGAHSSSPGVETTCGKLSSRNICYVDSISSPNLGS